MNYPHKLKAIVIDDEYPARLMIKNLAGNHSDVIDIIGEAKNGSEAIKLIDETHPDLIFLDINMPNINGFELLTKIRHQPFIIFTTAYEQYALKAFEANSIDYLIKPIEEKRFAQSISKLQGFLNSNTQYSDLIHLKNLFSELQPIKKPTAIPIKIGDKFIFIRLEDVAYLEAKEKYVYVVTTQNAEYLSDTRLAEFEETLPKNFIRVQKSFIINKDHISEVHKYFGNRLIIIMNDKNKTRITSGITYIVNIRMSLGL
ncbi:MAG: response regulator transcription factor [Mucilaginibacter sp.]|nr:response regulator transcription factor [Mucilaginibacter sp.]